MGSREEHCSAVQTCQERRRSLARFPQSSLPNQTSEGWLQHYSKLNSGTLCLVEYCEMKIIFYHCSPTTDSCFFEAPLGVVQYICSSSMMWLDVERKLRGIKVMPWKNSRQKPLFTVPWRMPQFCVQCLLPQPYTTVPLLITSRPLPHVWIFLKNVYVLLPHTNGHCSVVFDSS